MCLFRFLFILKINIAPVHRRPSLRESTRCSLRPDVRNLSNTIHSLDHQVSNVGGRHVSRVDSVNGHNVVLVLKNALQGRSLLDPMDDRLAVDGINRHSQLSRRRKAVTFHGRQGTSLSLSNLPIICYQNVGGLDASVGCFLALSANR